MKQYCTSCDRQVTKDDACGYGGRPNCMIVMLRTVNEWNVDHPLHYGGKDDPFEVIKVLEAWLTREEFIGALKFNVIKYEARANKKNGDEDYAKAAFYQNYLVDFLKRVPKNERPLP